MTLNVENVSIHQWKSYAQHSPEGWSSFDTRHCNDVWATKIYKQKLTEVSAPWARPGSTNLANSGRVRSIVMSMSVCLSVRSHNSKTSTAELRQFFCMLPISQHRQRRPSQCCNMLCTAGFVHDVTSSDLHIMALWRIMLIPKRN